MANVQPANRERNEFQLLKMIVEEIEKGNYRPGSTFREESEQYIYGKFRSMFGPIYSNRFLRSRIRTLKKRYQGFSDMMNKPGLYWKKKNNVVSGNKEMLREQYAHRYNYNTGFYHGEQNFDLMCQVFESGVKFK